MKYLKRFENIEFLDENDIKIGDYVKLNYQLLYLVNNCPILVDFLNSHIGKVKSKIKKNNNDDFSKYNFEIVYDEKLPRCFPIHGSKDSNIMIVDIYQILEFGTTIEELQLKISANKYNL